MWYINVKDEAMPENNNPMNSEKWTKERLVWLGITTVLLSVLVILTFAPKVLAQGQERDSRYYLNLFNEVFQFVQKHYADEDKLDSHTLVEGALKGMFEALDDPYSTYLAADEMRRLRDDTTGEFGGVGIYIYKTDNGVEVSRPIHGTPAQRAGIIAGDIIIAVEGEAIVDYTIDEVVKLLRGKPSAPVTMTVLRGSSYTFDVTVTRAMIEVPTVRSAMMPGGIGYLLVLKFTPKTASRIAEALSEFKDEGYKSLIIDVRSNPGGLLSSVVDVTDLFFEKGNLIVSTKSRISSENRVYQAKKNPIVPKNIRIVVLIDKYSASAAEILTGALKDAGRAIIMGETSYGKGSVQQIIPIDKGGFKLTTSKYYTPSGYSIDKIGVEPDFSIKRDEFSDEEIESYKKLLERDSIREFVKQNSSPSDEEITALMVSLEAEGISVRRIRIEKDIRDEINRRDNVWTVYDLEYDKVLGEAVRTLKKGN